MEHKTTKAVTISSLQQHTEEVSSSSNITDICFRGVQFISQPGHSLSWLRFCFTSLSLPRQMPG